MQITAKNLKKHGVELFGFGAQGNVLIGCSVCGAGGSVDIKMPRGWWKCQNGCNDAYACAKHPIMLERMRECDAQQIVRSAEKIRLSG